MYRSIFTFCLLIALINPSFVRIGLAKTTYPTYIPSIITGNPSKEPGPDKPLSQYWSYKLKNWTETDAALAVAAIDAERLKGDYSDEWEETHTYDREDYDYAFNIANREMIARFPNPKKQAETYVQMANVFSWTRYWESAFHVIDPVRILLENSLNEGQTAPDDITSWFTRNNLPITVEETISVDHLFGKGRPGKIFRLDKDVFWSILLILQEIKPGEYRLYTLHEDWSMTFQDQWTIRAGDFTGDGQTEIVIHHKGYGSGITHQCFQGTELFMWDGQRFQDLMGMEDYFFVSTDFGDCGGWSYSPGPNGSQIISDIKLIGTGCWETQDLTIVTNYQWNRRRFVWSGEEIKPYKITNRPDCALNWAYEVGPHNKQAMMILENALKEWPGENADWGPAAEDFFRYKLGLWYAFLGDKERAIQTLKQVRDQSAVPEFTMASKIASTFLLEYQKKGVFAGCNAVIKSISREIDAFEAPGNQYLYNDYDIERMQSTWGFGDLGWAVSGRIFSSIGTGRSQEAVICSLPEAFQSTIQEVPIQSQTDLIRWFYDNEIPVINIKEGDIDGDNKLDWLVLAKMDTIRLWAILQRGDKVLPVEIPLSSHHAYYSGEHATAWRSFRPSSTSGLYNAYLLDDDVITFQINGETLSDVNSFYGYKLIDVRGLAPNQKLALLGSANSPEFIEWDTATSRVTKIGSKIPQEQQVGMVEKALLLDQDPVKARLLVDSLLRSVIREEYLHYSSYENNVPRVKPYLLYLSGLCYEMSGEPQKAVMAYWSLWNEYPENPYTIIAKMRLELKNKQR